MTVVTKSPVNDTYTNPCGIPDVVTVSGYETMANHIEMDATGGLHIKTSIEHRGLQGIGVPSGKKYVGTDTTEISTNLSFNGASESTTTFNFSLVRQGEDGTLITGDDLRMRGRAHFTANANGIPTMWVDPPIPYCT